MAIKNKLSLLYVLLKTKWQTAAAPVELAELGAKPAYK